MLRRTLLQMTAYAPFALLKTAPENRLVEVRSEEWSSGRDPYGPWYQGEVLLEVAPGIEIRQVTLYPNGPPHTCEFGPHRYIVRTVSARELRAAKGALNAWVNEMERQAAVDGLIELRVDHRGVRRA